MNILIYGAGTYCSNLVENVKKYSDITIWGIVDSYLKGEKFGYPIIDMESENIPREIDVVIAMASVSSAIYIARKLEYMGFHNIYLYLNKSKTFINDFFLGECIRLENLNTCIMPSLEMHVVDFCNLNCRGCTHFSPIFDKKIPIYEERIQDIKKIADLYNKVIIFSLLGGEPLLNPELEKYIVLAREILPNSEIQLVTNGVLLLNISEKLLNIVRKNNITIVISEYKPTHMIINEICKKLENFQVDYSIRTYNKKQKFNLPLSVSPNSKYRKKCLSPECISICDGKIAKCPTLMYINDFNKKFGTSLPNQGIYDLKDFSEGETLLKELAKPVELCKHCIENEIDWSVCNGDIQVSDFMVYEEI